MTDKEVLLRPKEVEKRYKFKIGTLANWRSHDKKYKDEIKKGIMKAQSPPFKRIGHRVYYKLIELDAWVKTHSVE
jgi:hypothetical protein